MKRKLFIATVLLFSSVQFVFPAVDADSVSLYLLKRVSDNVTGGGAVSLNVTATYDVGSSNLGFVKHSDLSSVKFSADGKLLINSRGDKGRRAIIYNGSELSIYNRDKNTYSVIPASGSAISVIHDVSVRYGIDFPAADFFYPGFMDDALESCSLISYLGITEIDGRECFHIAAVSEGQSWQLWVSDDALMLPVRMTVIYTSVEGNPQYSADYRDWRFGELFPGAIFEFGRVPYSEKIEIKK